MRFSQSSWHGVTLVLMAAVLWGTTGTAHSFVSDNLSPFWVGALRLAVACAFFALLARWPTQGAPRLACTAIVWPRLLLCAVCMMVYNITFFAGLHYTGVGLGTAIAIGSSPLWAGLLQAAVQRNRLQRLWWLGSCVSVLGGFLMAWGKAPHLTAPWLGIALCLLAGLAYGAYAVISQPLLLGCGIARVNAWVFACAACMAVPIAVLLGGLPSIDAQSGLVVLYLGMIATGLAYLLFSIGLRSVSAATCVALSKLEPITAFALSIYIVGEAPSGLALSGLVIVLAGLWMVILSEMRHSKAVEVR